MLCLTPNMRTFALITWTLCALTSVHALEPERRPPAGMVGVVRLPELFGDPCERIQHKAVKLYSAPRTTTPIGTIEVTQPGVLDEYGSCGGLEVGLLMRGGRPAEALVTVEASYEEYAAIVIAKSGPWCKLYRHSGSAWIHEECESGFISIEKLLDKQMLYLLEGAMDQARSQPGGSSPRPTALLAAAHQDEQSLYARLLGHRTVGGHTWLHLEASWVNDCERRPTPQEMFKFWLPLRDASGRPNVWFHARGC